MQDPTWANTRDIGIRIRIAVEGQVGRTHNDHKRLFFSTPFIRMVAGRSGYVNDIINDECFDMTTDRDDPAAVVFLGAGADRT